MKARSLDWRKSAVVSALDINHARVDLHWVVETARDYMYMFFVFQFNFAYTFHLLKFCAYYFFFKIVLVQWSTRHNLKHLKDLQTIPRTYAKRLTSMPTSSFRKHEHNTYIKELAINVEKLFRNACSVLFLLWLWCNTLFTSELINCVRVF